MKLPFELKGGLLLSVNSFLILILAFPVQVLVARYLGPSSLGEYAYVLSLAVLARSFVSLGLQDALIPLYKRNRQDSLFGTAFLMRKAASILITAVVGSWVAYTHSQGNLADVENSYKFLVIIGALLFSDHEVFAIWWKSEGRLSSFVAVDLGGTVLGLTARLVVVSNNGSMLLLLTSYLFEEFVKLLIALGLYFKQKRPFLRPFSASTVEAAKIATKAWPIWLSGLITVAYSRVDQVLLGKLLTDSSELGHYSVAIRLIEAASVGALALFIVYLPILSANSKVVFNDNLQRLHDLAVLSSLVITIPLVFLLEPIVVLVYGPNYQDAAKLSVLYLAVLPTNYLRYCRTAFLFSQDLQKLELALKVVSLALAVSINLYLIPRYGALGAVRSAITIQWVTYLLPVFFLKSLRPLRTSFIQALLLPNSLKRLKLWLDAH